MLAIRKEQSLCTVVHRVVRGVVHVVGVSVFNSPILNGTYQCILEPVELEYW